MNIGLFGGSFDPPHHGHLIVAQDAAVALRLDRILFMPAALPPHKQGRVMTAPDLRARMLELALAGDDRFACSRLELDRPGPSYTVDTLDRLTADQPDARWTLLLGADQYADFQTWRRPDRIRELASVAVLTRGGRRTGWAQRQAAGPAARHDPSRTAPVVEQLSNGDVRVAVTRIDISSTVLRQRVAAGHPIRYLVPPPVEAFIFEQRLYHRNGSTVTG
ncbi:MAG TPA: nicotinate-nucleotide adenylyltransferase [Longimicrobiales bacterium]|nr:nicotinate-nucleotide adenylyltransferase [Longimicrobiales bacterium]